ncbi:hypothetical protein ZPR_1003 [Zunongwangia profunda SM-A87]|uniref:Uncharacterized protein n=1 Tax=Zunongwangia profunda (strain DSM 18752 / CCTCC AB 206139 / SM-A87) TaxID=655815 RepID=D5BHW0_ZUNPS|nr:hypothetical protein ZPR_1003 [Zunongwangia profunda SM-A87]
MDNTVVLSKSYRRLINASLQNERSIINQNAQAKINTINTCATPLFYFLVKVV